MLLDWLGGRDSGSNFRAAAAVIEAAIDATIADPASRTRDMGGTLGTAAFARRLIEILARAAP